jgi:hypothetical protein
MLDVNSRDGILWINLEKNNLNAFDPISHQLDFVFVSLFQETREFLISSFR